MLESNSSSLSHYDVLEVPQTSSFESIKASYQAKARKLHPDKAGKQENGAAFLRIQRAWECLRDAGSRKDYDAHLVWQSDKSKSQEVPLEDWELVEEEDSGDLCYVYSCRCGEDLWLPQKTLTEKPSGSKVYITCDGCSLLFHCVVPPK